MGKPNTLIFVDIPSDDTVAAAEFYHRVFGWEVEGRPEGVFHRVVPGGFFPGPDGSDSEVGNLLLDFLYRDPSSRPWFLADPAATPPPSPTFAPPLPTFNGAFLDPWGTTVVLWTKGGDNPELPPGYTGE